MSSSRSDLLTHDRRCRCRPQQQFHSEAPTAEEIHTQTESMASNDAAVNTGKCSGARELQQQRTSPFADAVPAKFAKMALNDEMSFKELASGRLDVRVALLLSACVL